MGCFDATCSISRIAISDYDPILMVVLDPKVLRYRWNTYQLLTSYRNYQQNSTEKPFTFTGVGHYNSYGGIVENDRANTHNSPHLDGDWWDYQFLVHKDIAEGLLGYSLTEESLEKSVGELVELSWRARLELRRNFLLGIQFADTEEIKLMQRVQQLTQNKLAHFEAQLNEYE